MLSFKTLLLNKTIAENIKILLFAFLLSCALWYSIVGTSQVEADVSFHVEYTQLPENLMIIKGMEDFLHVRVRSSGQRLRSVMNNDYVYHVNLKDAVNGANVYPVEIDSSFSDFKGMEILSTSPSYIMIETDTVLEKRVPIEVEFSERENEDLYIRDLDLSPSEVRLKGPREVLENMYSIKVPFDINQIESAGEYTKNIPLTLPKLVEADIPVTRVSFEAWFDLVPVNLTRLVQLEKEGGEFRTEPRTVNIDLEIPQSKLISYNIDPAYMAQVRATVQNEKPYEQGQVLPVRVILPKGANLLSVTPQTVKIIAKEQE
jgi:YbbR domain-containing protein